MKQLRFEIAQKSFSVRPGINFWDSYVEHRFNLALIDAVASRIPQEREGSTIAVTDGDNIIFAKRTGRNTCIVTSGKRLKKNGEYVPKDAITVNPGWLVLEAAQHFIEKQENRDFDMSLIPALLRYSNQARIGQDVLVTDGATETIGARSNKGANRVVLVTGYTKGISDHPDLDRPLAI